MNGRVYAPGIGRMLSPDPVTQAPENGQNYNRYSYAYNNPLRYKDPTGYELVSTEPWTAAAGYGLAYNAGSWIYLNATDFQIMAFLDEATRTITELQNFIAGIHEGTGSNVIIPNIANADTTFVNPQRGDVSSDGGDEYVENSGVVGVTDPNFNGFKVEDIHLNNNQTMKIFDFFFWKIK